MTWLLWFAVFVLWLTSLMINKQCRLLHQCLIDIRTRTSHLEAGRGTLTALCCDLERQIHVLSHRLDVLQTEFDAFNELRIESLFDGDDEPFTPDTDMED